MRDAMRDLGRRSARINPLLPAELVIDHSVQVDAFASRAAPATTSSTSTSATASATRSCAGASRHSTTSRSSRRTRASSTRSTSSTSRAWSSRARDGRRPSPTRSSAPTRTRRWSTASACSAGASAGSRPRRRCSERRSRCSSRRSSASASPASCREGATATDLVLTVTADPPPHGRRGQVRRVLRRGLAGAPARRSRDDREHVARVRRDLRFLPGRRGDARLPAHDRAGRDEQIALVEAYCKEQGLFHDPEEEPTYSDALELDLGDVEPSLAGPRRPQDRVPLSDAKPPSSPRWRASASSTRHGQDEALAETFPASDPTVEQQPGPTPRGATPSCRRRRRRWSPSAPSRCASSCDGAEFELEHGSVVIAAITSCTNTSNPSVMIARRPARQERRRARARAQAVGEVVASRRARRS